MKADKQRELCNCNGKPNRATELSVPLRSLVKTIWPNIEEQLSVNNPLGATIKVRLASEKGLTRLNP
jgi:hypothetical protein